MLPIFLSVALIDRAEHKANMIGGSSTIGVLIGSAISLSMSAHYSSMSIWVLRLAYALAPICPEIASAIASSSSFHLSIVATLS